LDDRDVRPGVKHYDWEIKGAPIRLELGPRDLESGNCVLSLRTGGKEEVSIEGISETIRNRLDTISDELRSRSSVHIESLIRPFPGVVPTGDKWELAGEIEDGVIYEIAFDGNDSDAEVLEKLTGLAILGDCDEPYSEPKPCVVTGRMTTRKQHLARMY